MLISEWSGAVGRLFLACESVHLDNFHMRAGVFGTFGADSTLQTQILPVPEAKLQMFPSDMGEVHS